MNKQDLEKSIVDVLKTIFDPEIPVNIYELGLIYEINLHDAGKVHILMTLTTPNCPVAESMPAEVNERVRSVEGVKEVEVEMTFDPPWDEEMLTDEAKLDLGLL